MANITIQIRISPQQNEKLKKFTLNSKLSRNAYAVNAINAKLISDEKELKEKGYLKLE